MKSKVLCFLSILILFSCTKEEEPDYEISDSFFRFSQDRLFSPQDETVMIVKIVSNEDWELVSHPDWITVTPESGNGNADIKLEIAANTTGVMREGTIVYGGFFRKFELVLTQQKYPMELLSYTGSDSPVVISEPKYLKFNTPVTLNYIMSGSETISFHIGPDDVEYLDDNRTIRFTGGPSYLGASHPYKFMVTDGQNNQMVKTVDFNFYTQNFTVPGEIKKVILDSENNFWVCSINSTADAEAGQIIQYIQNEDGYEEGIRFALDIEPTNRNFSGRFFLNPFNDLFYIPDFDGKQVVVYSKLGELIKKIELTADEADDLAGTSSSGIGFNSSGLGILNLTANNYSGIPQTPWNFIDSANDDQLIEPTFNEKHFHKFILNHDKSKLFLFQNESPVINILGATQELEEINLIDVYGQHTVVIDIFPNRLNDKLLVTGKNQTQVITPDLSYIGAQFTYGTSQADFSYNPDFPNHFYAVKSNHPYAYFELMDYENNTPVYSYQLSDNYPYGGGLIATPDDKFIIIYNSSNRITIYKTEMFE